MRWKALSAFLVVILVSVVSCGIGAKTRYSIATTGDPSVVWRLDTRSGELCLYRLVHNNVTSNCGQ